jgi:signal transduction histidine kinase
VIVKNDREKHFTVDAALLRELGERLIGKPHIALAEIIKNSYDADAFKCDVRVTDQMIEVVDNGHGMDFESFESLYLRLGSQNKREREFSPVLKRPLTGSKGVGRLAAQFLGSSLLIETVAKRSPQGVRATIDWSLIHAGDDLVEFPVYVDQLDRTTFEPFADDKPYGTRIRIENLRTTLGEDEIGLLGREVWSLRSPFERTAIRGRAPDPRDFDIEFSGDVEEAKERFDEVLDDLTEAVWRAQITGHIRNGRESDVGSIEIEFVQGYPEGAEARTYRDDVRLSQLKWAGGREQAATVSSKPLLDSVEFTIFVYRLERTQPKRVPLAELRDYLERFGSVSLYDTTFRLPYYGIDNDWLDNGEDYGRRLSTSPLLPSKWNIDGRYMLDLPEPRRLFGWVEISTNHEAAQRGSSQPGEWLEIQAGRDRLVDNKAHQQLQAFVRYALDLYANRYRARLLRIREATRGTESAERKYSRLRKELRDNRDVIPADVWKILDDYAADAERTAAATEKLFDARMAIFAPLATAGMAALGMTHEMAREARLIDGTRKRLTRIARDRTLPELKEAADDLGASLARVRTLQSLFSPLLSKEDREGDDRLRAEPIVEQVTRAMAPLTPGMELEIDVDEDLRFPAGPLAAWNAVLQNVLANSWNASLGTSQARVRVSPLDYEGWEGLWISDKGVGVDLDDSDRLFDAFERDLDIAPEHEAVAIGGQGMGLAIVRVLCEKYGAEVSFVDPEEGYATTFEIAWKA